MRVLIVHAHPDPESYNSSLMRTARDTLAGAGHEVRLIDLYAEGFDPVLSLEGWRGYENPDGNARGLEAHVAALRWAEALLFVYPTWWYGLPAMLKGWLDRVMLPDVAFLMPQAEGQTIRPGLTHVDRLGVFTTCGASRWLTLLVGAPGKRTLLRGIGLLCGRTRRVFAAHYLMDSSTATSRARHLDRVGSKVVRLVNR